jgi:hypothetical protein
LALRNGCIVHCALIRIFLKMSENSGKSNCVLGANEKK